jgi:NAD(P)-dependent dehydrogenase (short-subunit alcohol dehydrogenase family)
MELGNGKVAVVTGAGSGIGLALSHAFAGAGCSVVLADVQDDALAAADEAVSARGVDTLAVRTDVSDREQVEALAAATIERFGTVNVVCNNAGVGGAGDPWLGPLESWEWVMGVNFWGVVYGVRTFLPHLVASGDGHLVNTASILGLFPGFNPAYDASKHAVVAVTEQIYHAMADADLPVGVSCLCPGWVKTGILESDRNWPDSFGPAPESDEIAEITRGYAKRAVDEGAQPAAVADAVLAAIREGRYWVFPNPEFLDIVRDRFDQIGAGDNPVRAEQIPGMPPRSQMMAEVMEAMEAMAAGTDPS